MTAATPAFAPVTILMGVRNGGRHLGAQLDSILAQTGVDWRLVASDDGSQDDSLAILGRFAAAQGGAGRVQIVAGPCKGFARNFLSLIARADGLGAVALADQDDIWFPDKLSRALDMLGRVEPGVPALYCSRRLNWHPETDQRSPSRRFTRPPSFANALVENIAAGNTIVLNASAARLARQTAEAAEVPFHDWWLYLLVTGCGGRVIHDPRPGLLYRRHDSNTVGPGEGLIAGLRVKLGVLRGRFSARLDRNLMALQRFSALLTPENQARLADFSAARQARGPRRLWLMRRAGVYRQGIGATIGLWGAICLGRI